jgi:hypothetical protein
MGLVPDEVIEFLNSLSPSRRTMALGSIQPLTEMITRNLPGGVKCGRSVGWPQRHLLADFLKDMEASASHNPRGFHVLLQG